MDASRAILCMFLVASACLMASTSARKLLLAPQGNDNRSMASSNSSRESLFLSALPKGTTPSSTPSKKVHAAKLEERKLIQDRHERILQSVPSPGVGH